MSKQTALDWYWDKIKSHFEHDGDLFEAATFTFAISKQKEKEMILESRITSPITTGDVMLDLEEAEQYYNETYKQL
jgi:hypothetical protein